MTDEIPKAPDALNGEDWAGDMGAKWLANLDRFEGMIAPIGEALLDRAEVLPGQRCLDIGPGGGATTLEIARRVAPGGIATGVDISSLLAEEATRRAEAAGIANARFVCADASRVVLDDAPYDRLISRFGSMFFEQPVSAFAHLRSQLKPGARIDLAVWGPPRENLWMMEMMGIVREHVEIPPAVPRAPGPFAFEDLDYLNEVLAGGGFSGVDIDPYEGLQPVGGPGATPGEAVRFALESMAVGRALAEQAEAVRQQATDDLVALFERHFVPDKGVMMACNAWLVTAQA